MDNLFPENLETVIDESPVKGRIFGLPIPTSLSFLVGCLLFFLPFLEIKCNTVPIAKVTGVELATGYDVKLPGVETNSMMDRLERLGGSASTKRKPYLYALVALGLGVLGCGLTWIRGKVGAFFGFCFGVLAFADMILIFVDVKKDANTQVFNTDYPLTIDVVFSVWFFLSMILFAVAAVFGYLRIRRNE